MYDECVWVLSSRVHKKFGGGGSDSSLCVFCCCCEFFFVVGLCQFWPGTFVSTIVHPLHLLVQIFAISVLFFFLICLNFFKHV